MLVEEHIKTEERAQEATEDHTTQGGSFLGRSPVQLLDRAPDKVTNPASKSIVPTLHDEPLMPTDISRELRRSSEQHARLSHHGDRHAEVCTKAARA